MNYINTAPNLA